MIVRTCTNTHQKRKKIHIFQADNKNTVSPSTVPSWIKIFHPQIFVPKKYVVIIGHDIWMQKAFCKPPGKIERASPKGKKKRNTRIGLVPFLVQHIRQTNRSHPISSNVIST